MPTTNKELTVSSTQKLLRLAQKVSEEHARWVNRPEGGSEEMDAAMVEMNQLLTEIKTEMDHPLWAPSHTKITVGPDGNVGIGRVREKRSSAGDIRWAAEQRGNYIDTILSLDQLTQIKEITQLFRDLSKSVDGEVYGRLSAASSTWEDYGPLTEY